MKINVLVPDGGRTGGGARIIADYARFLSAQGHDVVAYVADYGTKMQRLTDFLMYHRSYKRTQISNLVDSAPQARRFDGLMRIRATDIEDGDIVISTWWETAEWMTQLPRSKGKHVHFVQGHEIFPYLPQDRTRAVYSRPDHKIAVSSWLRELLWSEYGVESQLVLNGVDTEAFKPISPPPQSSLAIGFMWSSNSVKNVARAISAIKGAKRILPSLSVHVFGARERPEELPEWIQYTCRPTHRRIVEIYSNCDAWLFTSDSEGFGLPILEAMACGTPVFGTQAGAATDVIEDGINGRLLPFSSVAFRDAILELANASNVTRARMAVAARRTAEEHDVSFARRRFENVLEEILSKDQRC